jgi:copper chaperone CopZ
MPVYTEITTVRGVTPTAVKYFFEEAKVEKRKRAVNHILW